MIRNLTLFIILCISLSCNTGAEQDIDPSFQKYFDDFIREGNKRGMNLVPEEIDIKIKFGDIGADGQCNLQKNEVTIDTDTWNNIDEIFKSILMYHELGHCILDRRHVPEKMPNGECISIMRGGGDELFECFINFYSESWWQYYLDELFDPETPIPSWYSAFEDYNSFSILNLILEVEKIDTQLELDSIEFSLIQNFNIDMEFDIHGTDDKLVKYSLGNLAFSKRISSSSIDHTISLESSGTTLRLYQIKNSDVGNEEKTKLTIRRKDGYLYFYANDRHLHTMESELWNEQNQLVSFPFSEPQSMKLIISEIE